MDLAIDGIGLDHVDELRELWLQLHEHHKSVAGYAMVKLHKGPDDSSQLGDGYAEVWTLVVDKAHRGGDH